MNNALWYVIGISGIVWLMGVVFFTIGIALLKGRKKKSINCTEKTYGKVKDIVKNTEYYNDSVSYSWHPVFEYNIGELKFIKESIYGSSNPKYAIGQDVEIYYNPNDYNDYYVAEEALPKTLGIIFTIVGIAITLVIIFVDIFSIFLLL